MTNASILVSRRDRLCVYELTHEDVERKNALSAMFVELMPQYAFYVERILRSIQWRDPVTGDRHHVWLAEVDGEPAGLAVTEYLAARDMGLGMDIAVYPQFREVKIEGMRVAQALIKARINRLAVDGQESGRTAAVPLAVEVDAPNMVRRFQEYGMVLLPIRYYEPPDVSGKINPRGYNGDADIAELEALGYHPMHLGVYPPDNADFDVNDPALWKRILHAFYVDHYHLTEDNRALLVALDSFGH